MKKVFYSVSSAFLLTVSAAALASAQVEDAKYNDWSVYTTTLQGKRTCYMASAPKSNSGNFSKRDDPYFLLTRIDGDNVEISTSSGYNYKPGSDIKLDIDGKKFTLFSKGELAWAKDGEQDKKIVQALKSGKNMEVQGTSQKGTFSIDKYSLRGVSAAIDRVHKLCS